MTRRSLLFLLPALLLASPAADGPQFTPAGELLRPENYREWIYLSSGVGMVYGPAAEAAPRENPPFDNVFVNPAAYRSFKANGIWPDDTMLVLEIRASQSKASIDKGGHSQGEALRLEAQVKQNGQWMFYDLNSARPAKPIPATASCYTCHAQKGAVDNTFVQFYPTLAPIAKAKGTFKTTE